MFKVFNMGIGMVVVVAADEVEGILAELAGLGETPYLLGEIGAGKKDVEII